MKDRECSFKISTEKIRTVKELIEKGMLVCSSQCYCAQKVPACTELANGQDVTCFGERYCTRKQQFD